MRFSLISRSCAAVLALAVVGATMAQENPYKQPLRVESVEVHVVVADASPAEMMMALASEEPPPAEIRVTVRDYLPRALEPTLLIGDEVASRGYRIVDVQDNLTTLGFILIDPGVVTEDSEISIQMGSDTDTRAAVEQPVSPTIMRMLDPQSDIGLQMMDAQKLLQQELR